MIQIVVSIYDRASGLYTRPVYVPSTGAAIRSFSDEINDKRPDNQLNKHPDDFDLFQLATWDDNTGAYLVSDTMPALLALGKQQIIN